MRQLRRQPIGKIYRLFLKLLLVFGFPVFVNAYNRADVEKKLDNVLSQDKYRYHDLEIPQGLQISDDNPVVKMFRNFFEWLGKILEKVWEFSPIASVVILVILGVLLTWLVIVIIRKIDFSKRYKKRKKPLTQVSRETLNYMRELNRVTELMGLSRFKEAIRVLINALWLYLSHNRIINYDKSRTNREYLKTLKSADLEQYKNIDLDKVSSVVFDAERTVYFKEKVLLDECQKIFYEVKGFISR